MKKPVSNWAVLLWIAAGLFAVVQTLYVAPNYLPTVSGAIWSPWELIRETLRSLLFPIGVLAGLGALIELADQIRWHTLHPPK
jgi:hypothetical protein